MGTNLLYGKFLELGLWARRGLALRRAAFETKGEVGTLLSQLGEDK